jgi:hypothetical protein
MDQFSLCKYKNILGNVDDKSGFRILGIRAMDIIITIVIGFGISKFYKLDLKKVLIILFLLGIILHRLFCVRTTIDKLLFK